MSAGKVNIALAKGERIIKSVLPLLEAAGVAPRDLDSRRLIVETESPDVCVTVLRGADVPTYVEYGAADLGIAGKDVLMEHPSGESYEVLDLGVAPCRMVVAGRAGATATGDGGHLRVATKYVKSAREYFASTGRQVEMIRLYGSMELAPLTGLADLIVDLVDTGNTLKANGLHELEEIMPISARLIAGKAAMKTRPARLLEVIERLRKAVKKEATV